MPRSPTNVIAPHPGAVVAMLLCYINTVAYDTACHENNIPGTCRYFFFIVNRPGTALMCTRYTAAIHVEMSWYFGCTTAQPTNQILADHPITYETNRSVRWGCYICVPLYFFKFKLTSPPIISMGWGGVGWQRHCCKTCRSLHELDRQGLVFVFLFFCGRSQLAVESYHLCGEKNFHSAQGKLS